jgi:formylglycine-generating enzyme required for sulfatase activity
LDAGAIIKRLDEEPDITVRRALLLSLGEFSEQDLPPATRTALMPKLQAMYRREADPGLHASVEWLLRQWKQEDWLKQVNEEWAKDKERRDKRFENIQTLFKNDKGKAKPQWYVNCQGQTMVVIPGPVEFEMGSPSTEEGRYDNELQHKKWIGGSFAISAKSVTVEEYRRFNKDYPQGQRYAPTLACPVIHISWYQAAEYCNRLSEREGIPRDQWCYETNFFGQVTKLKAKYRVLTGYRLPTEEEWEYACRAGAVTSRYYGETEELLAEYGWFWKNASNRSWPVGGRKPNDLGLFDMHGNVWNWCQEKYQLYPQGQGKASGGKEDDIIINSQEAHVVRGGAFRDFAENVRSAYRRYNVPSSRYGSFGFRPARTIR